MPSSIALSAEPRVCKPAIVLRTVFSEWWTAGDDACPPDTTLSESPEVPPRMVGCQRSDLVDHGPFRHAYPNGKPELDGWYYEGELHGQVVSWSRLDGVVQKVEEYDRGELVAHTYYPEVIRGRRDGVWIWYRADGSFLREEKYRDGRRVDDGDPAPKPDDRCDWLDRPRAGP